MFFLPFGLLAAVSGHAVLDQLPDAQRAWIGSPDGLRAFAFAVLATCTLALILFILGRLRSDLVDRLHVENDRMEPWPQMDSGLPRRLIWLIIPATVLIACITWYLISEDPPILWARLLILILGPVVIVLVSAGLRRLWWTRRPELARRADPPQFDSSEVDAVYFVGDVLAAAILVFAGLSLLRAFTPLLIGADQTARELSLTYLLTLLGVAATVVPCRNDRHSKSSEHLASVARRWSS